MNKVFENHSQRGRCAMWSRGISFAPFAGTLRTSLPRCRRLPRAGVKRPALHSQKERHWLRTRRIVSRTVGEIIRTRVVEDIDGRSSLWIHPRQQQNV